MEERFNTLQHTLQERISNIRNFLYRGFSKENLEFVEIYRVKINKIILRVMIDDQLTVLKLNTTIYKTSLNDDDIISTIKSIRRHYKRWK